MADEKEPAEPSGAGLIGNLTKAWGSGVAQFRNLQWGEDVPIEEMQKAMQARGLAEPTDEKPRALFHDPYSVMDWGGWRERPSSVTYDTLRSMATKNTVVASIILLRVNQISQFARPQQGRYDKGYKVILRDRRDAKRTMTRGEQQQATEIERMLETTGILLDDERPSDRDNFRSFIKKWVRDQLIYDQFAFEKIRDRSGRISRFIALPSETIRPAVMDEEHIDAAERRERVSHVQVYEDTVIAEFSPDDIAWCVMNPRSDLRVNSFGFSPLEQSVNLITAWLFGFEYNQRFFTQGSAIKGILNVKGAIPDRQLRAFRRLWYSMVSGVSNAWRTPILNSEDIQWVSMHSTNREMEFGQWMDWLTKLLSAMYQIDPIEINFQFGNTGQKQSMGEGNQEYKIVESKDKGLRPTMEHIQDCINTHMVWEINEDFEFAFTGIDGKAEEKEREGWVAEVKAYKTINEVRAEADMEPLPPEKGDVILDSTWAQLQGAGDGGDGDGDGDDDKGNGGPLDELGDDFGNDDDDEQQDKGNGDDMPGSHADQSGKAQETGKEQRPEALAASLYQETTDVLRKSRARMTKRVANGTQEIIIDIEE